MRLYDEGISVRKSVVTILREVLLNQPSHAQYTELCVSLLQKLSDVREEDTVKDIIRATFQCIWFTPPTESTIQSFSSIVEKNRGINVHYVVLLWSYDLYGAYASMKCI